VKEFDVVIIGAGIVGAAAAWQLIQKYPSKKILLGELRKRRLPYFIKPGAILG
jgi:L-2-hydroxyglutarate oxidase LhgO